MIRYASRIIRRDPRRFVMDLLSLIAVAGLVYVSLAGALFWALCDQLRAVGGSCF